MVPLPSRPSVSTDFLAPSWYLCRRAHKKKIVFLKSSASVRLRYLCVCVFKIWQRDLEQASMMRRSNAFIFAGKCACCCHEKEKEKKNERERERKKERKIEERKNERKKERRKASGPTILQRLSCFSQVWGGRETGQCVSVCACVFARVCESLEGNGGPRASIASK